MPFFVGWEAVWRMCGWSYVGEPSCAVLLRFETQTMKPAESTLCEW